MENARKIAIGLLVVGAINVILSGISIAAVEQERRVTGLANVASLDYCKVIAYSELTGIELRNPYPPKDCDAPNPLDVQESVSTTALILGIVSLTLGGVLLFVSHKRPDLLSREKWSFILPRSQKSQKGLDGKLRSLDKLRKDGLLTDSEFQAQKKKLLEDQ